MNSDIVNVFPIFLFLQIFPGNFHTGRLGVGVGLRPGLGIDSGLGFCRFVLNPFPW